MAVEKVTICGGGIKDKHTHYEAYPYVGPGNATVIIRGDIAQEFQKKYGYSIRQCKSFEAEVHLSRNSERIKECQDPYKSPNHLMGSIYCLDDIVVNQPDKNPS